MITVEDVWKLALPEGTELAGGTAGLWHQVSWVARMLPRPPGFEGLKGGEVALISIQAMKLLDERLTLGELLLRLGDKHVAGVAVLGDVAREAAAVADQRSIPLLALREGNNLYEIEQSIMRLIAERRAELYQRSQEIFQQLTELAIDGKGLPAILKRLSTISGKAVVLQDEDLVLQHFVPDPERLLGEAEGANMLDDTREEVQSWSQQIALRSSEPPTVRIQVPRTQYIRLVTPVSTQDRLLGFLSLVGRSDSFSEIDKIAITRAVAACAIDIARDRAVLEAQDRFQTDFIEDLLTGNFNSLESVTSRAKRLGYSLTPPYAVIAIAAREKRARPETTKSEGPNKELMKLLEREVARLEENVLFTTKENILFLLTTLNQSADASQLKRLGEQIKSSLQTQLRHADIAVGVGRVRPGLEDVKLAYQEARQALGMGIKLFGPDCLVLFGELGIYRLLFNLHGTPDLQSFYKDTLGTLIEYDRKNRSELLKTLQAYFASCNSLTDAAEKLHLHRNTLLYRLHRVREIAGLDLDDPEVRLSLQLALRIGETLQAAATDLG